MLRALSRHSLYLCDHNLVDQIFSYQKPMMVIFGNPFLVLRSDLHFDRVITPRTSVKAKGRITFKITLFCKYIVAYNSRLKCLFFWWTFHTYFALMTMEVGWVREKDLSKN